jgi:purine-binding chemotaxis protein CheW
VTADDHKPTSLPMSGPRQLLTFSLGTEQYGVDILRVQEIRGWAPVTRIPKLPPHVLGVLNLRGTIVPIIDLRVRFSLPSAEFTALTVIVVLSVECADGTREFGAVVDGVSDVVDISADQLKKTPNLGNTATAEFIQGLAVVGGQMIILLNIDELIRRDIEQVAAADLSSVA